MSILSKEDILKQKSGMVEVRSVFNHTGHTRIAVPKKNKSTNWYYGVEPISKELRDSGEPFVDPNNVDDVLSRVTLVHKKQFNLENKTDRLILNWLLECKNTIALSYEESLKNSKCTFYIHNELLAVQKKASRFEVKDTAIKELADMSVDNMYKIARLLGHKLTDKEPSAVRLFLREQIENDRIAQKFLDTINDKNITIKSWIFKAIDKGIINKKIDGSYYFESGFIGRSMDTLIYFFKSSDNKDIVNRINEMMA